MDVIFDTADGSLTIHVPDPQPWGAILRAVLNRHGQVVNLRGIEMRLTIMADGAQVFDLSLPPAGVRYKQTDQDILATGRVSWLPDQQIEVSAWCRTHAGHEVTAEAAFTAPSLPIDINSADSATLQTLDGVSAARAEAIIAGRPWVDPADLSSIKGVSDVMVSGWMDNPGLFVGAEGGM